MIFDDTTEFADAVSASGTDASAIVGDYYDLGLPATRDLGIGEPQWIVFQVATTYTGAGTILFEFRSSTATALTGGTTTVHVTTAAAVGTTLTAGTMLAYRLPIGTYQRYIGVWKTTVGVVGAGAINAFLCKDLPRNVLYNNAI